MNALSSTDQHHMSLAYLPPTKLQTRIAAAGAAVLLIGLAIFLPVAANPAPQFNGFIPALDAVIFVTDVITACLLFAHFSAIRSAALLVLACGYLFSAAMVVVHGLSFPGVLTPTANLVDVGHATLRIYIIWHLGLPLALIAYVWLKNKGDAKAGAHMPTARIGVYSVAGVLALVSGIAWLCAAKDGLLLSREVVHWLAAVAILISVVALWVLWVFRRSALDQWLMLVVLASIVELAITYLFGQKVPTVVFHFTLGFYTGRLFSVVTSTVVLTALLAETTRLYDGLARANMLASVVKASQALSSEIVLPKLIARLMKIAIENAGADRGLLILRARGEYLIRAEARAIGDQVEVTMHQEPITNSSCPESLVRYVARTQEHVTLDDASKPNPFSADGYFRDRRSKSVFCLPLVEQLEVSGMLLFENARKSHAFTPACVAVLELLAAQAAISLENARLYSDLNERESKVRRLVDSNMIGICIFDLDHRIIEANEAFLNIVGYSRDDLVAGCLPWTAVAPPEWNAADEKALVEVTATGSCKPYEKYFIRKDNSRVPVLVGGATFGEIRHQGVAFVVDLSERKRAEAELAHANRVATMGQLTASIAHEVSQPIAATLMSAEAAMRWLDRQPPNLEKARQSINRIIDDGKRAADIVSRIRDFSKKAPAQNEKLGINEAILEVMDLAHSEIQKNGILAKIQLAESVPHIFGDRVQIQQVILNLIVNAIEAMSEVSGGPRELLICTSKVESGGVLVAVSDSGPGLLPASLARIFEAFYTTKSNGLGMGLSICRTIVEAHGGRLWATQNEPHGAVFCVVLPIGKEMIADLELSAA